VGERASARIQALSSKGMLDELSRREHQPLIESIKLLAASLGNCHDKRIAKSIGLAVLETVAEFPVPP
jgi:hypothetical protein